MKQPASLTNEQVLDFLTAHKAENARELLEGCDLDSSGTKEELLERIRTAVRSGQLPLARLIERLDEIEGWGNQHVYLFKSPPALTAKWRDKAIVEGILRQAKKFSLLNRRVPLLLPKRWTLSSIQWTSDRVRFVWVTTRTWHERDPAHDKKKGTRIWQAYNIRVARGVLAFDWDLLTQSAMLLIERLPTGTKYEEIRGLLIEELEPMVDLLGFDRVPLAKAIPLIENSAEVRSRHLALMTRRRGVAHFTSAGKKQDVSTDPDLQRSRNGLGDKAAGQQGNFYWVKGGTTNLAKEVHTTLYAADDRIGIFGEHSEEIVRHVLGRVRHYCSQV